MTIERAQLASSFYLIDTISYIANAMQDLSEESACTGNAANTCSAVWEGDDPAVNIPSYLNPYLSRRNLPALRSALPDLPTEITPESVERAYLTDPTSNDDLRAVVALIAASNLSVEAQADIIAALYLMDVISYIANAMSDLGSAEECPSFESTCSSVWEGDNLDQEGGNIDIRMSPANNARTLQRLFALAADASHPLQQRFESRYLADATSTTDLETALCRLRSEGTDLCIDSRIAVTTDPAIVRQGLPVTITLTAIPEGLVFPEDVAVSFIPSDGITTPANTPEIERSADGRTLTLHRAIAADAALDDTTTPDVRENLRMVQITSADPDFDPIVSDAFAIQQGYPSQCGDGIDNDNNGLTDLADTVACAIGGPGEPTVARPDPTPVDTTHCEDGVDNDLDGFADENDADCQNGHDGAIRGETSATSGMRAAWRALNQLGAQARAFFGGLIPVTGSVPTDLTSAQADASPNIRFELSLGREGNPATFVGSRIIDFIGNGRFSLRWGGQPQHAGNDFTTDSDASLGVRLHTSQTRAGNLQQRDRFFAEALLDYSMSYGDRPVPNQFFWDGLSNIIGGELTLGSNFGSRSLILAAFARYAQAWHTVSAGFPQTSDVHLEGSAWTVGARAVIDGPALHTGTPGRFPTTQVEGYYSGGQNEEPEFINGRQVGSLPEEISRYGGNVSLTWDHNTWRPAFRAVVGIEDRETHDLTVMASGELSVENDRVGRIAVGAEYDANTTSPLGNDGTEISAHFQYTLAPWVPGLDVISILVNYSHLQDSSSSTAAEGVAVTALFDLMRLFNSPDRSHVTDWETYHHQDALENFSERPVTVVAEEEAEAVVSPAPISTPTPTPTPVPVTVTPTGTRPVPPPPEPEDGTEEGPVAGPVATSLFETLDITPTEVYEFDSADSTHWEERSGANGDPFACTFQPGNISFADGFLILTQEDSSCAEYRTIADHGFGYYEVTMQIARGSGLMSGSFFTYTGTYTQPNHHEIDIEGLGQTCSIQLNHYGRGVGGHERVLSPEGLGFNPCDGQHRYGFEWRPDRINYYIDGRLVHSVTEDMPSEPGQLMLNIWSGTSSVNGWLGQYSDGEYAARYDSVRFAELDSQPQQ